MKIQLAYKASGEDPDKLKTLLTEVSSALEEKGRNMVYVPILNSNYKGMRQTLEALDEQDALLLIIRHQAPSEGAHTEAGYAIGRDKKLIVAIKEGLLYKHTREIAHRVIEFKDDSDLVRIAREL